MASLLASTDAPLTGSKKAEEPTILTRLLQGTEWVGADGNLFSIFSLAESKCFQSPREAGHVPSGQCVAVAGPRVIRCVKQFGNKALGV